MKLVCEAPAKLNLCLFLGPTRDDGLHDLVSVFESISLSDEVAIDTTPANGEAGEDHVICPGISGENLVSKALRLCRERELLDGPPVTVTIEKQIPVAAGLGGGSADAAAALRLVAAIYDRGLAEFDDLSFKLGADVPSQLRPGTTLVQGAGERLVPIDPRCLAPAPRSYVVVAQQEGLSTKEVFAEADRLKLPRDQLSEPAESLVYTLSEGVDFETLCAQVHNDFAPAIRSLRPELSAIVEALLEAGAGAAEFTGSGPTCFGVFRSSAEAEAAAERLRELGHDARVAEPAAVGAGRPQRVKEARLWERR